jgi:hypothetical protein
LSENVAAQQNQNEGADDYLGKPSGHVISVGQGGGNDVVRPVIFLILTDQIAAA